MCLYKNGLVPFPEHVAQTLLNRSCQLCVLLMEPSSLKCISLLAQLRTISFKTVKSARHKNKAKTKTGDMFQFYHLIKHRYPQMKKKECTRLGVFFFTGFREFCCNLPTDFVGLCSQTLICSLKHVRALATGTSHRAHLPLRFLGAVLNKC